MSRLTMQNNHSLDCGQSTLCGRESDAEWKRGADASLVLTTLRVSHSCNKVPDVVAKEGEDEG